MPSKAELDNMSVEQLEALLAGSQGPADSAAMPVEDVVQEQHPDISVSDRLLLKNFGGSDQETLGFLSKKGLETSTGPDGQIIVRKPGEKQWKVLDPEGWSANTSPTEVLKDLGDVGYDVTQGAVQTIGSAAAGLAGGAASGGIGAVPSAMAAGAGIGGAAEGLRQALGNMAGVRQGADYKDLALQTGLGALGPALFGTGAGKGAQAAYMSGRGALASAMPFAKPAGQKLSGDVVRKLAGQTMGYIGADEALTPSMTKMAVDQLADAQRGGFSNMGSKILSKTSSIDAGQLQFAGEIADDSLIQELKNTKLRLDPNKQYTMLDLVNEIGKQDISDVGNAAANEVLGSIKDGQMELIGKYSTALQGGGVINMSRIRQPLEDKIVALRKLAQKNELPPESLNEIKQLEDFINQALAPPKALLEEAKVPATEADYWLGKAVSSGEGAEKYVRRGARAGEGEMHTISAEAAMGIKNSLADLIDKSKDPRALDNMSIGARKFRNEVMKVESILDDAIGESLPEGLQSDYRANRELLRTLYTKFNTPEKSVRTLKTLNNKANTPLLNRLKQFDAINGTGVTQKARLVSLWDTMYNPSWDALSSGGTTSTSRTLKTGALGSGVGYGLGLLTSIPGVAPVAAAIGGTLGTMGSSPAAVKGYLLGNQALNKIPIAGALKRGVEEQMGRIPYGGAIPSSAWNLMLKREN